MNASGPRTISAVAVLAMPAVLAAILLFVTLQQKRDAVAELAEQQDAIAHLRVIATAKPPNLAGVTDSEAAIEGSLSGNGTAAELSAQIAATITGIAANHGLQVMRTTDIAPVEHGTLTLVGTSVELTGTLSGVLSTLQELTASRPILFLSGLSIRSDAGAGQDASQEQMLTLSFDAFGVKHKAAVPAAAPAP